MITHRCKGNLEAQCPIRYGKRFSWAEDAPDVWVLYHMEYDYNSLDPFNPHMDEVAVIKYCPFCGERLEV